MSAATVPEVGIGLAPDVLRLERSRLAALVDQINDSSLDHVVVTDHVAFRGGRGWDAVTAMTLLAGLGIDKPLHTGVLILPLRQPTVLARQLLDLADFHAPGVVLGVGLGGDDPAEYTMAGLASTERGRRMDDILPVLAELLGPQAAVDLDGLYPVSGPGLARGSGKRVPILVGGRAPAAHRRAATVDGWLATFCSPARVVSGREAVEALADGRRCGYQAWVGPGVDGRANADAVIGQFYGLDPTPFHRYVPTGSPAEMVEHLVDYVRAGCDLFHLFAASPAPEEAVDALDSVAHQLREPGLQSALVA